MSNAQSELGRNRTGVATSPVLTKAMMSDTEQLTPDGSGDETEIARARGVFAREAEPLGTVPPPVTPKGMMKTAGQFMKGRDPVIFVDKLGERLAFERTGVRLYESLLSKFDALGSYEGGPSRSELEKILTDEFAHFKLLQEAIKTLGADPTVMTPSADVHATISKGALDVVNDPRTTLAQSLEAALVVELADNDCWQNLVELAHSAGQRELAERFAMALTEEQEHLTTVRRYVTASLAL